MRDEGGASVSTRRGALALLASATVAACARKPAAASPLRIGYQRSGVLLLAKSRGDIAQSVAPRALKWVEFPSGPPLLEALNAGAIDFGATGDAPPIFAEAAGAPLRYVACQPITGEGEAIVVPRGSTLKTVQDLAGKSIAFTRASSSHLLVLRILKQAGLGFDKVKPVYLAPQEASAAFARGAVDAWATWDPYLALAERDQGARILVDGRSARRTFAFYLASNTLIDRAPRALRSLLDALRREAAWGDANLEAAAGVIAKSSGLPLDIMTTTLRRGPLAVEPVTPEVVALQQASADLFRDNHIVPGRVDVGEAVWTGWSPRP